MHRSIIYKITFVVALGLSLASCRKDEFDGLLNVDPVPAAAITFPQSNFGSDGRAVMEDNVFIIRQRSVADGQVSVQLKVPEGQQITAVSAAIQRFRGTMPAVGVSPPIPSLTTVANQGLISPGITAITRNTAVNYTPTIEPGNLVTVSFPATQLPAVLQKETLGPLRPVSPVTPGQDNSPLQGDVIRYFFRVTLADGSVHRAIEARVVVVE